MYFAKEVPHDQASLRSILHNCDDHCCEKMGYESEVEEPEEIYAEVEDESSDDDCECREVHIQEKLPESCPLLRERQQELRHRVCEPSGSYSLPGPNQPFDSSTSRNWYDWILELFKEFLQQLEQKFRKALDWLQQIAADCLQGLRGAAEAVWRVLKDFCSSLEQLFKSLIQV